MVAPIISRIPFLYSTDFDNTYLNKIGSCSSGVIAFLLLVFCFRISSPTNCDKVELLNFHSKKSSIFFSASSRCRYTFSKYSEFWSFYVNRVHPRVPSFTTSPPSPYNRSQNKHVKTFHRFRVL